MRVVDLSYPIRPDMPVYPGTPPPEIRAALTLAQNGCRESALSFWSHSGTHMDAPAHFLPEGRTLDTYPISAFIGRAAVLDCGTVPPEGKITPAHLSGLGRLSEKPDFILLRTGHGRYWGRPQYTQGWPALDEAAAERLAALGLKGVGIDTLSFDPLRDPVCPVHNILLSAGLLLLETLANLELLDEKPFLLCALPLYYQNADGAPVRAAAILDH